MSKWNNQWTKMMIRGEVYNFRSKLEAQYAQILEFEIKFGYVTEWWYEIKTFHFTGETTGACCYLPDFIVEFPDGHTEIHECKGKLTGKDNTKFKRMAEYYPDEKIVLVCTSERADRANALRIANKYIERVRYIRNDVRKLGL